MCYCNICNIKFVKCNTLLPTRAQLIINNVFCLNKKYICICIYNYKNKDLGDKF